MMVFSNPAPTVLHLIDIANMLEPKNQVAIVPIQQWFHSTNAIVSMWLLNVPVQNLSHKNKSAQSIHLFFDFMT